MTRKTYPHHLDCHREPKLLFDIFKTGSFLKQAVTRSPTEPLTSQGLVDVCNKMWQTDLWTQYHLKIKVGHIINSTAEPQSEKMEVV